MSAGNGCSFQSNVLSDECVAKEFEITWVKLKQLKKELDNRGIKVEMVPRNRLYRSTIICYEADIDKIELDSITKTITKVNKLYENPSTGLRDK